MNFSLKNSGISPAVGVILLIGITAAVATIAGIVLLDVGENQKQVSAAGVEITETPSGVEVTWTDSGTAEQIQVLVDGEQITKLENVNDTAVLGTPENSTLSVVGVQDGDESQIQSITTETDTTEDGSTSTTVIESPSSEVTGTVNYNPPIEGAKIIAVDDSGTQIATTMTDANGEYTIEAASASKLHIIVDEFTHDGTTYSFTGTRSIGSDSTVNVDFGEVSTRTVTINGSSVEVSLGTSSDGFKLIGSVEQLQSIRDNRGKYRLISDIDASKTSSWNGGSGFKMLFMPDSSKRITNYLNEDGTLQSGFNAFTGVFDGNGHTISNLYIDTSSVSRSTGLMSVVHNANLNNITIDNFQIYNSSPDSDNVGVFGRVSNSDISDVTIQNTTIENTDSGIQSVGPIGSLGVLKSDSSTVTNSEIIDVSIISESEHSDSGVGGFAGSIINSGNKDITVTSVSVSGSVTGYTNAGGFVGKTGNGLFGGSDTSVTIMDSDSTVDVTGDGRRAGGFVGLAEGGTQLTNLTATGTVTSPDAGGFVGKADGNVTIKDSSATGNANGETLAGGFAAYLDGGGVTISDSYATGDASAPGSDSTPGDTGGFAAYVRTSGNEINNSYATGSVDGEIAGGFVGTVRSGGVINNSYSTGPVNGSSKASGFAGQTEYGATIKNSYTVSSVTGGSATGGFTASSTDDDTITDSYYDSEATTLSSTSASAIRLTTEEMQGSSASSNMSGLDFNSVWNTTNQYPDLQE